MKIWIKKMKKKNGGHYYILFATDAFGLKRIFGRFRTKLEADKKKVEIEKKYGVA